MDVRKAKREARKDGTGPLVEELDPLAVVDDVDESSDETTEDDEAVEEAPAIKLYKGRGCQNCNNTGYRSRVGLFEVLEVSALPE